MVSCFLNLTRPDRTCQACIFMGQQCSVDRPYRSDTVDLWWTPRTWLPLENVSFHLEDFLHQTRQHQRNCVEMDFSYANNMSWLEFVIFPPLRNTRKVDSKMYPIHKHTINVPASPEMGCNNYLGETVYICTWKMKMILVSAHLMMPTNLCNTPNGSLVSVLHNQVDSG